MQVRGDEVDVGLRLLDHQLVDSEGVRCGKVDDVLFDGTDGDLRVAALLSGPRAQTLRLPRWARRFATWLGRDVEHRVEWSHVAGLGATVELDAPAEEFALGQGDRHLRPVVERLPKS